MLKKKLPDAGFQLVNLARGGSKGRPVSARHACQGPPEAPARHGPPAAGGTSWACAACARGGSWACPSWDRSARAAFGIRWGRLGADRAPAGGSASSTGAASISRHRLGTVCKGGIRQPQGPAVRRISTPGKPGKPGLPEWSTALPRAPNVFRFLARAWPQKLHMSMLFVFGRGGRDLTRVPTCFLRSLITPLLYKYATFFHAGCALMFNKTRCFICDW